MTDTTLRKAAQAALDAWDKFNPEADLGVALTSIDAIQALRAALASPPPDSGVCADD